MMSDATAIAITVVALPFVVAAWMFLTWRFLDALSALWGECER